MKINGKLFKGTAILLEKQVDVGEHEGSYQDRLEKGLVALCHELSVEVPLWLTKNTREFVTYRRTSFNADQFFNPVIFERFEIKVE